jgi:hypothetical protein
MRHRTNHPRAQRQALQGRQAKHASVGVSMRRTEDNMGKQVERNKTKKELKSGTYILEHTRAFFTGRSDVPCSGTARFEPCLGTTRLGPAVLGAAPLQPAASTAATLSPMRSGAIPLASAATGARPWPRRR